jgi:hypothetical protein
VFAASWFCSNIRNRGSDFEGSLLSICSKVQNAEACLLLPGSAQNHPQHLHVCCVLALLKTLKHTLLALYGAASYLQIHHTHLILKILLHTRHVLSFPRNEIWIPPCLLRPGSVLYIQKVDAEFFMAPAVFAPNWDIYLAPQEKDTWVLCSVLSSKRYQATIMFVAFWFCSIYPKRVLDCFIAPAVFAQIYICGICLVFKTICVGMHVLSTSQICDIHPVLKNSHLPTMFCRLLKSAMFIWSLKITSNAVNVLSSAQICDTYLALNKSYIPAMFCRLLKFAISI